MASFIRQQYPLLANQFNLVFSKLKDQVGLLGVDISKENQNLKIRIIIFGNEDKLQSIKDHFVTLLPSTENIVWKLISDKFVKKNNLPIPDDSRSEVFSVIQPCIDIGDGSEVGTLGIICVDNLTKKICLLTAHHVVSKSLFVIQPSNMNNDIFSIAKFTRSDPSGDAAIFELIIPEFNEISGRQISNNIISFKHELFPTNIVIRATRYAILEEKLTKIGLTTGKTEGVVRGIGIYKHSQDYILQGKRVWIDGYWLEAQDVENKNDKEISFAGDSGSVWFDTSQTFGIGLQIAGDVANSAANQEFAIAQHLPEIMENLQIKLFT